MSSVLHLRERCSIFALFEDADVGKQARDDDVATTCDPPEDLVADVVEEPAETGRKDSQDEQQPAAGGKVLTLRHSA